MRDGVVRFLQFNCADRTMDAFPVESDLRRRKAESREHMGGAFPEALAPCASHAGRLLIAAWEITGVGQCPG